MENSNGDDSSTNEQSAANFYYSPIGYDFDDAAFLAGYPYSDVSDSEFEENGDFLNTSSEQDDNCEIQDTYGDDSISNEHQSEEIDKESFEEKMDDGENYDTVGYNMGSQEIAINELNIEEHHHDDHNLHVENGDEKENP